MRKATEDDLPWLLALSCQFHANSAYSWIEFVAEDMWETLETLVKNGTVFVTGDPPIELLAYSPAPLDFNKHVKVVQERLWYIHPLHRGGGMTSLREAERRLKDEGYEIMSMGFEASHPRLGKIYHRLGYRPCEAHFMKVL